MVRAPEWPTYVAWWVDDHHEPDFEEARERHEPLHDHGPTAPAFTFKRAFGTDGVAIEIDRERVAARCAAIGGQGGDER